MAIVHVNQLLIAMQNGLTFEEALKKFNLEPDDITEETHKELERQMNEHNESVSQDEQQGESVEDEINESNGNY